MPHPKYDIKVDSTVPAEQTAFITNTGTHDFTKLSLKKTDKPNEQDGARDSRKTKHKQSKSESESERCPE